jgi:hypothetical protein
MSDYIIYILNFILYFRPRTYLTQILDTTSMWMYAADCLDNLNIWKYDKNCLHGKNVCSELRSYVLLRGKMW